MSATRPTVSRSTTTTSSAAGNCMENKNEKPRITVWDYRLNLSLFFFSVGVLRFLRGVPMRVLLTNDDGIYAPGLRALRPELQKLGGVTVVAPATEQSAVGHSVTLTTPLVVQEVLDDE